MRSVPATRQDSNSGSGGSTARAGTVIQGKLALMLNLSLLSEGRSRLLKSPSYTATFLKQEKIGSNPLDELQTIEMKLRHKPFSVYMKWITEKAGQEVLFVEGELEGRMLVKKGGMMSRIPSVKIPPDSSLALRESRHPITDAGLLRLTEQLLEFRTEDLNRLDKLKCEVLPEQLVGDRKCYCFQVEYADPAVEPLYSRSLTWIDEELSIPICVKNYTWGSAASTTVESESDEDTGENIANFTDGGADDAAPKEPTLIEFYTYTDIEFQSEPEPNSFDAANSEYAFKRQ